MNHVIAQRWADTLVLATMMACAAPADDEVGVSESPVPAGVLDPNIASETELSALPHVDDALAKTIVAGRPFLNTSDLHETLRGSLGEEQVAELYGRLFLPINLNTASEAEMLLIPGVGDRLVHEFEEYRPYQSLAQFRREIGKYVDDDELDRLEQCVFVPVNVNTATDEEILAIPGVGERLLHEFREYRPFQNVEHFRREIGKYVDDNELARLERYITLD